MPPIISNSDSSGDNFFEKDFTSPDVPPIAEFKFELNQLLPFFF
jgi:hypothetical protein